MRARKDHRCDCCGGPIARGEVYERHFSVFDGGATWEKCCLPCVEIRRRFRDEHGTVGTPGTFVELLEECVDGLLYHPETAEWCIALNEIGKRNGEGWGAYESEANAQRRADAYIAAKAGAP